MADKTVALFKGLTWQGGSFLTKLLPLKGFESYGVNHVSSSIDIGRVGKIYQDAHEENHRYHLNRGGSQSHREPV